MIGCCNIGDNEIKIIKKVLINNKSITRLISNISINYIERIFFLRHMFENI